MIGRDHLDSGSVASPYRETEAMADGSDAIADWPLLNALVNTASGASWVTHPPRRRRRHRALDPRRAWCASPTAPTSAAQKLERVLTADPGMGVIRHADAGYERAIEVADERGVRIPMREGPMTRPRDRHGRRTRCCASGRARSTPTSCASPEVQGLIDDMIDTMRAANGAGLAANQVGEPAAHRASSRSTTTRATRTSRRSR